MIKMRDIFFLGLFLLAPACTHYLTVQPQGEVLPETDREFASLLHAHLREIEGGGDEYILGNMESIALYEGIADDLDATVRNGNGLVLYAGEKLISRQNFYRDSWKVIRDCNILIEKLKGRSSATARHSLSAAYAIKGVCYWRLMREFCEPWEAGQAGRQEGLPLVDRFDISARPVRASLAETAEYADRLFRESLALSPDDPLYLFTEWPVKGFRLRLAFWCEDWDSVVATGEDILAHSGFTLTPRDAYAEMIGSLNKPLGEVMLRSHTNNSSELDWYFSYIRGYVATRPASAALVRLFGTDPSKDVRFAASFNAKRFNVKPPECRLRLSEIVLSLAEAYVHQGEDAKALGLLNELRGQRIEGVVPYTAATLPPVRSGDRITEDCTGAALTPLMQAVFDERRREMYMEGDRWFELKRNGRPEWWVISNSMKYTTKAYMYTSPIYKGDVDMDPRVKQNPGYVY